MERILGFFAIDGDFGSAGGDCFGCTVGDVFA